MGTADQMIKIHRKAMENQKKVLIEAIEDMPMDAPIMSEINDEPMFLIDVYYDSVNNEIHIALC